jgi:phosphate acetyltransferase
MDFIEQIYSRAQKSPKRLVFAEPTEERVLAAIPLIQEKGLAHILPLQEKAHYAARYAELRKVTLEEATLALKDTHVLAALMVEQGDADGLITGPGANSKDRILPILKLLPTKKPGSRASGLFFMVLPPDVNPDAANGGVLLFADCALNIAPNLDTLVDIAIDSAETAKHFGIEPKIAMLSFSTAGSSQDEHALLMREATQKVRLLRPDLLIEGEVQADAALIDSIGKEKDPNSAIAGQANILIFPDLEAGNIAYKLVERLGGAHALGPVVQGLSRPVCEASRGCSVEDLVSLAAITTIMAS